MPICINCTNTLPFLYTVYESANNLRLEQCSKCAKFADPYVEYDTLTLLLDLILLKRGVFRHILFNRGYEPRRVVEVSTTEKLDDDDKTRLGKLQQKRENSRWATIFRLGTTLTFIDAFIRWSHLNTTHLAEPSEPFMRMQHNIMPFLRVFAGCAIETLAFHTGVTLTSALTIRLLDAWTSLFTSSPKGPSPKSGVREEFKLSHVPLTLFFSSLTKLFLLLLLTLWRPSSASVSSPLFDNRLLPSRRALEDTSLVEIALNLLDDDKLDREWVIRNVLGGMAAGFGLRVVLDIQPAFTTFIVLMGWAMKTFVANSLHPWVSNSEFSGDVFLSYSIP